MRWLWLVLLVGCEKAKPADDVPTRQVFIEPKGVWVNKEKKVAAFENLDATRVREILEAAPEADGGHGILVDVRLASGDPVAAILEGATRIGWKKVSVAFRREDKTVDEVCNADFVLSTAAAKNEEMVTLSVWVTAERTWVGLSRVNEFQDIPVLSTKDQDSDKLETTLKDHKRSAFFSDREDIEISFDKGLPLHAHYGTLAATCKSFHQLSVMPPDNIAAKPTL